MTRAVSAAAASRVADVARSAVVRLVKGAALAAGLIALGVGAAAAQGYGPYDPDPDPAPKYGKGPSGGYGYGRRPYCDPNAENPDPRCYGPLRRPYRGDGLARHQYELGRLLGMIHPVASACTGLTLNQRAAEAALERAQIEMGNPPPDFHTGYRLGKHLSQQMINRYGTQYFCNQSWHRFGPTGYMWRGILLPDPSR